MEVKREIYLEWYRSERRERYQKERDKKYGVCSLEGLEENGCSLKIEVALENVTEEAALRNIYRERLLYILGRLPEQERWLMWLLYFEGTTAKEMANILGCS